MYETIQTPFNYGGLTLKNRIIFAPTTFGLSDEDYFEKIHRIAAGGCAMIIVGDVPVGKSHFGKSLFDKKGFAFYQKVIGIAHDNDCKVCAQLHQSDSNIKAMLKYVPGVLTKRISMQELRPLLNNEVAPYITNMPHKKVKEITSPLYLWQSKNISHFSDRHSLRLKAFSALNIRLLFAHKFSPMYDNHNLGLTYQPALSPGDSNPRMQESHRDHDT